MNDLGKLLIYIGLFMIAAGIMVTLFQKMGIQLGKLPGDIVYKKGNTTVYFPIVTSILISILVTVILWIFRK